MPAMAKYTLPDLRYDYGALEPHVSGKIMQLHHDKHHAAYVGGANKALEGLEEARAKNDFTRIAALEKQLGFHLSGHVMHSLFWQNLTPKGGGEPSGDLGEQITKDFGSFAGFKAQFTNCAMTIMGSGWAALQLGSARQAPGDDADPRPPVGEHDGRRARHGARRVGARLVPAVPERQGEVLRGDLERVELGRHRSAPRRRRRSSTSASSKPPTGSRHQ